MACTAFRLKFILKQALRVNYQTYRIAGVRNFSSKDDENCDPKETAGNTEKAKTSKHSKSAKEKAKSTVIDESKQAAAKEKLLSLLSEVKVDSKAPMRSNLKLARPPPRPSKKERFKDFEVEKTPAEKLDLAVKGVAESFKTDSEKVESELKEKLISMRLSKDDSIEVEQESASNEIIDEEMKENLMSSVHEVASTVAEPPVAPKSELTRRLLRLSLDSKITPEKKKSMLDLLDGLRTESKAMHDKERTIIDKNEMRKKRARFERQVPKEIDLFGAPPLNIFPAEYESKQGTKSDFWRKLQERELKLLVQYAPTNAFEEMIMWTEQGKHWKFPIDNQTEMGAEENVGFNEHIFLEQNLQGFPDQGPIRHFMELVCVGLSKNPYITIDRKIENINWFRNYFMEKEDILKQCGAIDQNHSFQLQITQ
ncbi:28S ribosomal protein S31, mitochondrial-like [Uloborus diversus]|uniref:28S ribosomal protein S31, mitochondrial-like n=1 Tax=Uloborus diversus TaxID=327109 RepID=UPI00240A46C1|nr:28S ribosomal protein S31, mitochondrial-like [Uloborus diversus]